MGSHPAGGEMPRLDPFIPRFIHSRLAGHGPTLFAGLSKHVDLKLVSRLEFGSGAVAMRYEPRRWPRLFDTRARSSPLASTAYA
jgi:hypothetical protein